MVRRPFGLRENLLLGHLIALHRMVVLADAAVAAVVGADVGEFNQAAVKDAVAHDFGGAVIGGAFEFQTVFGRGKAEEPDDVSIAKFRLFQKLFQGFGHFLFQA